MDAYSWIYKTQQGGPYQASISIKPNAAWASTVSARMRPYKNFPEKFRPALEAVADYMRKEAIPRVFKSEGPGWRQLSKRTQHERMLSGYNPQHPILRRTGDLFQELTEKAHPKHIEIIKTGKNARVIVGGRSEKFIRNQLGNSFFNIPMRPMIPGTGWLKLNQSDDAAIRQIMTEKIQEAVKHG